MIKVIEDEGVKSLAIVLPCMDSLEAVSEMRRGLVDVMDSCLQKDEDDCPPLLSSLWFLHKIIEGLNITNNQTTLKQWKQLS